MTRQIYPFLHRTDDVFDLAELMPLDLEGWGSHHPIFEETIGAVKPTLIFEVGTWKGASAIHMAKLLQKFAIEGEIVCIDTFLGSPEHWTYDGFRTGLNLKNGRAQLYTQFLSNVIHEGLQNVITPFPISSTAAADVLRRTPARPDLVYIDAGHEYADVRRDIDLYWNLLRPGGVLIGDDFIPTWHGVIRAASEFAAQNKLDLKVAGEKWSLRKPA
jgi:SAM-dependent methyltransferase